MCARCDFDDLDKLRTPFTCTTLSLIILPYGDHTCTTRRCERPSWSCSVLLVTLLTTCCDFDYQTLYNSEVHEALRQRHPYSLCCRSVWLGFSRSRFWVLLTNPSTTLDNDTLEITRKPSNVHLFTSPLRTSIHVYTIYGSSIATMIVDSFPPSGSPDRGSLHPFDGIETT